MKTNTRYVVSGTPRRGTRHGILARAISHLLSQQAVATQKLESQVVACLWMLAVICGCLGLIGIGFSTFSAHFRRPDFVLPHEPRSICRRARRDGGSGPAVGPAAGIAASYARYSSEMQREESIEDQRRKCRERAGQEGHHLLPEFEFSDEAVSGTKLVRVGLQAMMAAAVAGRFQVLYFHNLSRLARESVITMPMLKELVYNHKIRVISVTEGIDSDREGWDMMATMLSLQHERYIKDLSDNVFRGQEGNVLARLSVGDYCFGYTSVPVPGGEQGRRGRNAKPRMVYAVDPETADWVRRIFHWFVVERRGLRWITRELNRLGAPKDHRSTTKQWHHQYLPRLLRNRKFVGVWPWGGKKNVRNPLTGQVRQEDRPDEDIEQWTRHFPELQIIDNETFDIAQRLLQENVDTLASRRGPNGKVNGSAVGAGANHPRHLLSGLICCQTCGARFYVGGANGKYLFCPNYHRGTCQCQTQLLRERAERLILDAIGQRMLANPAWRKAVLDATLASWANRERERPGRVEEVKAGLATLDRKIARLLDQLEDADETDLPAIRQRHKERVKEKNALTVELRQLDRTTEQDQDRRIDIDPTEEWVMNQLRSLADVLTAGTPAAALALRELVGGQIVVEEIREPGRKRYFLRGRFTIKSNLLAKVICPSSVDPATVDGEEAGELAEEIVIDFVDADPLDELAEKAKQLYDQDLSNQEISRQMNCSKSQITKLLGHWSELHSQPLPDGRSRRWKLPRAPQVVPAYQQIADDVSLGQSRQDGTSPCQATPEEPPPPGCSNDGNRSC